MQREVIEKQLQYEFTDSTWLTQAFTHPSASQSRAGHLAYERLEYLGDAVLELVISAELFTAYPEADEGQLTDMRAAIVSRQHLSGVADSMGWGEQIIMSPQLEKNGGRRTRSILANTFESAIGAVMMDGGYAEARRVACLLMRESLTGLSSQGSRNPKGELQEVLQSIAPVSPTYMVEQLPGMPPAFAAKALWFGVEIGAGTGSSKRLAETAAAADALQSRGYLSITPPEK